MPLTSLQGTLFSNMAPCPVRLGGHLLPDAETAYQMAKTVVPEERKRFLKLRSPYDAKRLGRTVTLRPDWEQVKFEVMLAIIRQKFHRDPFRAALLATEGDIVEGNTWHDNIWGDCHCGGRRCQAPGQNRLGLILMQVREEERTRGN